MSEQYHLNGSTAASIAGSIEQEVLSGALAPGELLPPVRTLAAALGVSAGTVAAAYRLAGQRGLTLSDRRRGTRVRPWRREGGGPPGAAAAPAPSDAERDLASGTPDPRLLAASGELLACLDYRPGSYGAPAIAPELAEVARVQLAADHVPAEHLGCTSGALDAMSRLLAAFLHPGDRVGVEDPGWPALIDLVGTLGLRPVPMALDDDGPLPDSLWQALAGGARAVVVTSRAQNPTGAALSEARADDLAAVLERYPGVVTIEDDHGHLVSDREVHPLSGGGRQPAGPSAFVRSAAKGCGPDLRVAVVAGDDATLHRLDTSLAAGQGWVSYLLQQLVAKAWSRAGTTGTAAATYDLRRRALVEALQRLGVACVGRSGLNVWVPVADEAAAVSGLLSAGWRVAPGRPFRLASAPGIRITTASLEPAEAPALAATLAQLAGRAPATRY